MPNLIFISYRRTDDHFAARIREHLVTRFGEQHVFMDAYSIEAGADFPQKILNALKQCDVMLVLISEKWLNAKDDNQIRRLDNPDDWVRREIIFALDRGDVKIIPVYDQNVTPPSISDLPDALRALTAKEGIPLHGGRAFNRDIEALINEIQDLSSTSIPLPSPTPVTENHFVTSNRHFPVGRVLSIALIFLIVIAFVILLRLFSIAAPTITPTDTLVPPTLYFLSDSTATESIQPDTTATETRPHFETATAIPTATPTKTAIPSDSVSVPTCTPSALPQAPSILTLHAKSTQNQMAKATLVTYTPAPTLTPSETVAPPILTIQAQLIQSAINIRGCS